MQKKERQKKLLQLIKIKRVNNQLQLLREMEAAGIETNQASISRDLNELGIVKIQGIYHLPEKIMTIRRRQEILNMESVGEHLITIRTAPAQANVVAAHIDEANLPGVAGTIAGDDTIFVAVINRDMQKSVSKWLFEYFMKS